MERDAAIIPPMEEHSDGHSAGRIVKVIMVGAPRAGKSSLMRRYDDLEFDASYVPTTAGDFTAKAIEIDGVEVSFQIWDVGGSGVLGKSFLRGTHGVLLVADITSKASLKILNSLYESVKRLVGFADDSFPCVVVANKLDLVCDNEHDELLRQITLDGLRRWADARRSDSDIPITFFEVSAKDGYNVIPMFESIVRIALNTPGKLIQEERRSSLSLNNHEGWGNESPVGEHSSPHKERSSISSWKTEEEETEQDEELNDIGCEDEGEIHHLSKDNLKNSQNNSMRSIIKSRDSGEEGEDEQAIAKVIIAGAASVGKTFILNRFVGDDKDQNNSKYEPTIGADLRIVDTPVKDRTLTLQIWDTSGNPKMLAMGRSIYRDADCLIMVYDITSRESFEALETYWEHYLTNADPFEPDEFPVLLVGNKCDLSDRRAVSLEEVVDWCAKKRPRKPVTYIECSALCSMGVSDIFVFVADAIYDYALAADSMQDSDDESEDDGSEYESEGGTGTLDSENEHMYPVVDARAGRRAVHTITPGRGIPDAEKSCWVNPFSLFCS